MPDSRYPSLWIATSQVPTFPRLTGDRQVDVAIVGAGIVGVLCAHRLTQTGRRVALIEGAEVLQGVTGFTTAKVSASHGTMYSHIANQFDEEAARLHARANLDAIDWIEATTREKGIDCDFRRKDLYLYAENEEAREQVALEASAAKAAGLDAQFVEHVDVPFENAGAAKFANQAEFHPLKFLIPLLREAAANGCEVYGNTRVEEVEEEDEFVLLGTVDEQKIRASHVIIASHYPFFDPAFYYARLEPFRDYAIAAKLEQPFDQAMYVGSNDGYTYRSQPSPEGELLIVSGAGHKVGKETDTDRLYQEMEDAARKQFTVVDIPYRWSTQDNDTVDKLPYIGKISANSERVWIAAGFGGWGMTQSVVSMMVLTDSINGKDTKLADLYDPRRFKPVTSAPTMLKIGVDSVKGLIGERLSGGSDRSIADLKPGEAEVIDSDDGKVAAYRDDEGALHTVSAVCTHMGCILNWNSSEKSWDCPCHGSRFNCHGKVLHGPAVADLERKEV